MSFTETVAAGRAFAAAAEPAPAANRELLATGLAYVFHWGEISFLYRYIDFQIHSSRLQNLTIAGPLLGATFRW